MAGGILLDGENLENIKRSTDRNRNQNSRQSSQGYELTNHRRRNTNGP